MKLTDKNILEKVLSVEKKRPNSKRIRAR